MKSGIRILLFTLALICFLIIPCNAANQVSLELKQPGNSNYLAQSVTTVSLMLEDAPLATDIPAYLSDGRTMVPVRVISEALQAQVSWDQEAQQVTIQLDGHAIVLTIDSASALVDGQVVTLYDNVPATLVRDKGIHRTMVPLRFVTEQLGAQVLWDSETYTVTIVPAQPVSTITEPILLSEQVLTATVTGAAQPVVFSLPERVVIDFPGAVFSSSLQGSLSVSDSGVQTVRYNQYDTGYEGYQRVARIVLDLHPGFALEDVKIDFASGILTVTLPALSDSPVTNPTDTPNSPPSGQNGNSDDQTGSSQTPGSSAQTPDPSDTSHSGSSEDSSSGKDPSGAMRIVLDAGHGGTDTGAIVLSPEGTEIYEKEIDLSVTVKVGELLTAMGYEVLYTRQADETWSLEQRAQFANQAQADLFICIHANSFPANPAICGIETYYLPSESDPNSPGKLLAQQIQAALLTTTGAEDRSARPGNYYVLRYTQMPAVLIEMGYLTNPEEQSLLLQEAYQDQLAAGIASGIHRYVQGLT